MRVASSKPSQHASKTPLAIPTAAAQSSTPCCSTDAMTSARASWSTSGPTATLRLSNQLDLFEWVTLKLIEKHLDERFKGDERPTTQYYALARLEAELSLLLSTVAHAGHPDDAEAAKKAFHLGAQSLKVDGLKMLSQDECGLVPLENALDTLNTVALRLKRDVLQAAALCAASDRTITADEAELLRAIGDMLGVPTPPLLPGQKLA